MVIVERSSNVNSLFVAKTSDLFGKTIYLLAGDDTHFAKLVFLFHIIVLQVNKFIMMREKSFMKTGMFIIFIEKR